MEHIPTHGILFRYLNTGVLLTGKSGIGKSDLVLELIYDGAQLICDDSPNFKSDSKKTIGYCKNSSLNTMMHIRGLGVICIASLFGKNAVIKQSSLDLIINLVEFSSNQQVYGEIELLPNYQRVNYSQNKLMQLNLVYDRNRSMALLVKTAIKQFSLKKE